jgi:hypothetical protein
MFSHKQLDLMTNKYLFSFLDKNGPFGINCYFY